MEIDERYMRRALGLARKGLPFASPNPMVGAVIVDRDGRIIGEGYHRRCGEAHAEVNAVNSVADKSLLRDATMYVTLEPCAHYGRTGPCAELLLRVGVPRVVVGCRDPFDKVNGKGIEMLRQGGVEVAVGCLEDECRRLNAVFFTAHEQRRPFVMLKWAQTTDGYIDAKRGDGGAGQLAVSTPLTMALMHRLRGIVDAVMVGSGTALADHPALTTRYWPGDSPLRAIVDRRRRLACDPQWSDQRTLLIDDDKSLAEVLGGLYGKGITSLMVEGGERLLASFISAGLWDMARVETSPVKLGDRGGARSPLPLLAESGAGIEAAIERRIGGNAVRAYVNNPLLIGPGSVCSLYV